MSSTSNLPGLNRRTFVAVAASAAVCMPALAQHAGHGAPSGSALPEAKPSSDPFVRLFCGTPHHLTTEQIDPAQDGKSRAEGSAAGARFRGGFAAAGK